MKDMVRDSASQKRIYREHTRVKHHILEKYVKGWLPILGKFHKRLVYFDGFAGRGQYQGGEPGSPVTAMTGGLSLRRYFFGRRAVKGLAFAAFFRLLLSVHHATS